MVEIDPAHVPYPPPRPHPSFLPFHFATARSLCSFLGLWKGPKHLHAAEQELSVRLPYR